jgi:hypothetical protein
MPILYYCEDCGEDFEGWSKDCLYCGEELCYECYHEHLKNCPNSWEDEEDES